MAAARSLSVNEDVEVDGWGLAEVACHHRHHCYDHDVQFMHIHVCICNRFSVLSAVTAAAAAAVAAAYSEQMAC